MSVVHSYHPSIASTLISVVDSPLEDYHSLDSKQVYRATPAMKMLKLFMKQTFNNGIVFLKGLL